MRLLSMLIGRISVNTDFFDYICPVYPYFLTNETALPNFGGNRIVRKLQSPPELGDLGGDPSNLR